MACCGEIPVVVLSQDPQTPSAAEWTPAWEVAQEGLKALSPRSRRVIARGSGHFVMIDRPDLVIAELEELSGQLRPRTVPAVSGTTFLSGSTVWK